MRLVGLDIRCTSRTYMHRVSIGPTQYIGRLPYVHSGIEAIAILPAFPHLYILWTEVHAYSAEQNDSCCSHTKPADEVASVRITLDAKMYRHVHLHTYLLWRHVRLGE